MVYQMSDTRLTAHVRHHLGKVANRQLRQSGQIPANLYGNGVSCLLAVDEDSLRHVLKKFTGLHELLDLKVIDSNKGTSDHYQVLVQEIQQPAFQNDIYHVDFILPTEGKRLALKVPLKVVGKSTGEKKGGVLQMVIREVPIFCHKDQIPEYIEVDVSNLDLRETIRLQELTYPEGIEPQSSQNYSVVAIVGLRAAPTQQEFEK